MATFMVVIGGLLLGLSLVFVVINETFRIVFLGICLALLIVSILFFVFGLLSPLFIQSLVNNPEGEPILPRRIHFFTFIEPGQVKIIVRGKRFIRAIINDSKHTFLKKGNPRNAEYWQVIPIERGEISEPLQPLNLWSPLSWWAHWVYYHTGAVFVGIGPIQGVRVEQRQYLQQRKEKGKVMLDGKGLPILEEIEEWSDYLRVKGFIWYFKTPMANTKDYLNIGFQGNLSLKCVNPYLATYNHEHWDSVLSNKISSVIVGYCKSKTYAEISTSSYEERYEMAESLKNTLNKAFSKNSDEQNIGMEIFQVDITDQNSRLSEEESFSLTEPWRAEQTKKATITKSEGVRQKRINESEGDAQAIVNRILAIKTDREIGAMLARYDAWKNTAEAGGSTYFFGDNRGGNSSLDPIIFAKLKEQSENKGSE